MSKMQQDQSAGLEYPDLAAAYQAWSSAATRINEMVERFKRAKLEAYLRKRDREALGSRAASGETITGADVRKAEEAVADAEATITLLTEALPPAMRAAHAVSRGIPDLEFAAKRDALEPFYTARDRAKEALTVAQAAFDAAQADAERLPQTAADALEALLIRHGRDERVRAPFLSHVADIERQNAISTEWNRNCNPGNEKPLKSWLPE